jgi:hypothetical protein
LSISKYIDLLTAVKFVPKLVSILMAMDVQNVRADQEVIEDSADCLEDIVVGAEEVVSWRLGIDGVVDIFSTPSLSMGIGSGDGSVSV